MHLKNLGIELASEEALNAAFARFKELADKKREIFDEDIYALISDEAMTAEHEHYRWSLHAVPFAADWRDTARAPDAGGR